MGSSVKTLELHTLLRRQFFKKPVEEEAVYLVSPLSYLAMTVQRGLVTDAFLGLWVQPLVAF